MSPKYASVVPDSININFKLNKKPEHLKKEVKPNVSRFELPLSPEESKEYDTAKYLGSRKTTSKMVS